MCLHPAFDGAALLSGCQQLVITQSWQWRVLAGINLRVWVCFELLKHQSISPPAPVLAALDRRLE